MLIKKPELLKKVKYYQTNEQKLSRNQDDFFASQIDGESLKIRDRTLTILVKNSL